MTRRRKALATNHVATVASSVARLAALLWLAPALLVNLDWSADASIPWNTAAAGSILASAVFIEAALRANSRVQTILFGAGAALLITANLQIAFDNAAQRSAARSDHRGNQIQTGQRASSQRLQWSQERDAAVVVAGLIPAVAIRADVARTISQNAARWRSTNSCNPGATTARHSIAFCARLMELRGQLAAAELRDQLNRRIRDLDLSTAVAAAPTVRDPFVEQSATVLSAFGVRLSGNGKTALSAIRDFVRSLALELMAALGPSAWLLLMPGQASPRAPQASMRSLRQQPSPSSESEAACFDPLAGTKTDPFGRFAHSQLEPKDGAQLSAGAAWMAWQAWCAKEGIDPGSQKKFGSSMKRRFKHERNSNRPRYVNVAVRVRMLATEAPVLSQGPRHTASYAGAGELAASIPPRG